MFERGDNGSPENFDQALADSYVGKYILVGITYYDQFGKEIECVQLHGVIEKFRPDGVYISLRGKREGETWIMPPDFNAISSGREGKYTLKSTGEIVENPNLVATWSITKPSQH